MPGSFGKLLHRKFTPLSVRLIPATAILSRARHLLVAAAALGAPLPAADLYWDANGDTAGLGGTGAWNTSDPLWRNGGEEGALQAWANGNTVFLAGVDGTLTLGTTLSATSVQVSSGNFILSGSQSFSAGALNVSAGASLRFSTGTAALSIASLSGAGTLILNNGQNSRQITGLSTAGSLNFGGVLQLRGGNATTSVSAPAGHWFKLGGGSSVTQAAGTSFALDTGASATDAKDIILSAEEWGGKVLTLSSLSGFGAIRSDWGNVTSTKTILVNQSVSTTFNGMILSHGTSAASRRILVQKDGVGTLTLANVVGLQTQGAGGTLADHTASIEVLGGTLVMTANNTATGTITVRNGALLRMENANSAANFTGGNNSMAANYVVESGGRIEAFRNGAAAFGTGSITLSGGSLHQTGGNWTWTNNVILSAGTASFLGNKGSGSDRFLKIQGVLSGSGDVTFDDTPSALGQARGVILTGANTLSGAVTVNTFVRVGGVAGESTSLDAGTGGTLGTATVTINSGRRLTFSRSDTHAVANSIGGAGTVYIGSTGITGTNTQHLTLSGANTYSGGTELLQGTLRVNALSGIGTGYLAVKNGAAFVYAGSGAETTTRNLFLDLGASFIEVSQAGASLTWNDGAAKNGSFTKRGDGALVLGGGFSGAASIRVEGGLLILNGTHTNTGKTTVAGGILRATQASSLGQGTAADSLTLAGGTVALARGANTTFGAGVGIGTTLTAGSTLSLDRSTSGAGLAYQIGTLELGGQTLSLSRGAHVTSGIATLVLGGALSAVADSALALGDGVVLDVANGASTGGTSLTKSGAGTLILRAGSNLGGLNVTGGRVDFASSTSLGGGEGTLAFADGAAFDNSSGGDVTFSSSKSLAFAGTVTFLGSHSLGLGSGSGALVAATTLQVQAGTLTLGGDLTGAFGLTKSGSGTLVISGLGASTAYAGDTWISAGELSLVNGSTFRSGTTVTLASGATLRLGAGSTLGGVTLVNNGGTLITTDTLEAPITYAADLTLGGSNNIDGIQTIGTGTTVTLSGDYLGTNPGTPTEGRIVISGGATLRATETFTIGVNKGIALGAGSVTLSSDAGKSLVIESVLSGAGSLVKAGSGGLRLTGVNTFEGGVTIQGGTLGIATDASLGAGSALNLDGGTLVAAQGTTAVTVSSSRTVTLAGGKTSGLDATTGGSLTYDGAIGENGSGAASLRIGTAGARLGTVYLGGANTFTGTTTVAAGTLVLKPGASLGSGSVSVGSGATLANQGTIGGAVTTSQGSTLQGTGSFQGQVTVSGTHAPGNSPGIQVFESGLTYDATSVLEWEFQGNALVTRGADYDGINVTGGALSVDPLATLKVIALGLVDYANAAWAYQRTFEVVSITGATFGGAHQFGTLDLTEAGNYASRGSWDVLYRFGDADGVYLQWTPVPEPSTYGVAAGLLALGAGVLRRRRAGMAVW
jgi:fibronectin-binding autotransporter adhesin